MNIFREIWESLEMLKVGFMGEVIGLLIVILIFALFVNKC